MKTALLFLISLIFSLAQAEANPVHITYFWGDGCPFCAAQDLFFEELEAQYPNVIIERYEVWYHPENRPLFERMAASYGVRASGVPMTFIGEKVWSGFNDIYREEMLAAVERYSFEGVVQSEGARQTAEQSFALSLPLLSSINLQLQPIVLSTVLIAFVDGFNPCSLWVLTLLLGLVIHSGSRVKVMQVGLTFLLVTALIYGLFMTGLLSVLSYVGYLWWIQILIALFALTFALVNIKDYFWYKRGLSFTISDKHKPGLYRQMRGLLQQDSSLKRIGATAVMATGISLIELPCTAGFPVLWSSLLAGSDLAVGGFALLLGLYLLVYLLDELLIFGVAATTLRIGRFQERHGRFLKLLGGIIMLHLALVLFFRPEWMKSLSGLLLVFTVALAVTLVTATLSRLVAMPKRRTSRASRP